jgi:phosphoserine phosphatase
MRKFGQSLSLSSSSSSLSTLPAGPALSAASARRLGPLALLAALATLGGFAGCGTLGSPRTLYLARHGQTDWNRVMRYQGDPDLDPVGYLNRVSLWSLLKDRPLGAIYTSEMFRTKKTAEPLAKHHHLQTQPRAALNEIDAGILEGICHSQMDPKKADARERACEVEARGAKPDAVLAEVIQPVYAQGVKDPLNGKAPLGESYMDLVKRTAPFVEELDRGDWDREVLVVTHGVVLRALLHHLMGWSVEITAKLRTENDQVYKVEVPEPGSGGKPKLSLFTPGLGWKACETPPAVGARSLDCAPTPAPRPKKAPTPVVPLFPGSQPAAPATPTPPPPPPNE